jgi:hypothetical protein
MSDAKVVCVLGMHRSGTSLITRMLNFLGVDLGPEEHLLEPAECNPKGFWEHQGFVAINDAVLEQLGGHWDEPPRCSSGWERLPKLNALKTRARSLIQKEFATAQQWGWKDPRTCLTLPFWQDLLPSMHYVLCGREPGSVALSLERRDGFTLERGLSLWLEHTYQALKCTAGAPRLVVLYEDAMHDCTSELRRLASFLGKKELAEDREVQRAVAKFVDSDLQHHRRSDSCLDRPGLDPILAEAAAHARAVYAELKQADDGDRSQQLLGKLEAALALIRPVVRDQELRRKNLEHQQWLNNVEAAGSEIAALVPPDEKVILVDDDQWAHETPFSRDRFLPFLERDGEYWGQPPDDDTAIRELHRLRRTGVAYMAFGSPAFWWLEHYPAFHQHLRSQFPCVLDNDRLVVFQLSHTGGIVDEKK